MSFLQVRNRTRNWLQLMRLQFLPAGFLFLIIGSMARGRPDVDTAAMIFGIAAVVLLLLSFGLVNELTDWKGDRFARRTAFSGGSGVLASGAAAPSDALAWGIVALGLSFACAWQVHDLVPGRDLFLPMMMVIAILGWGLSVRPLRLIGTGAGELTITAIISIAVPYLGHYLAHGRFDASLLTYLLPLIFFTFAFTIAAEYPDRTADIRSRKTNLVYRFGTRRMGIAMMISTFLGYGSLAVLLLTGEVHWLGWSLFLMLPFVWAGGMVMSYAKHHDHLQASVTVWFMALQLGLSSTVMTLGLIR
ncbi:MAG TPA: prenyltransferase [Methanomassiliicoccales archaeon]|nr:prenyltransferase [Methanomassiliicoccales archaeon]